MATISASTGSAGTPGFTFDGDTNTGLFSPGGDQIAITTNGTERLRVTSDGSVGIANVSPTAKLRIDGAMPSQSDSGGFTPLLDVGATNDGAIVFRVGLGGVEWRDHGVEQALVSMPSGEIIGIRNIQGGVYNASISDMVNLDLSAGGDGSNSTTQRRGVVAFNYLTGGGVEFWDGAANRIARFGFTDGTSHNQRAIFDVGVELRADQSVFVGPTNPRPYLFQKTVTGASANPGIGVYVTDSSGTPSSFSHLSASAFYTASDARLKSNIETLEDALAILCRLRGVRFVWDSTGEASVGVIAQEVQTALPEAVGGDPSGDDAYDVLGVTDMPLLAVIIEAVKDLATRVTAIESA